MVLLKVSPCKNEIHFRKPGMFGLQFIGAFRVTTRVSKVAYRLELPDELNLLHNTFHFSQLRKWLVDDSAVIPLEDIQVNNSLNYIERPVSILDRKTKELRNKRVELVKVLWHHRKGSEWTWELEEEMREHYPEFFTKIADFEDDV